MSYRLSVGQTSLPKLLILIVKLPKVVAKLLNDKSLRELIVGYWYRKLTYYNAEFAHTTLVVLKKIASMHSPSQ